MTEATPAHALRSEIRQRLPEKVFDEVFRFMLGLLEKKDGSSLLRLLRFRGQ
jgi:hypothetical protein